MTKRILPYLLFAAGCLSSANSQAERTVDQIINQIDPKMNIGIVVVDLSTGATLYQRNAEKSYTPASNMKLFSNAAAMLALGPDYRISSSLSTNAPILNNGVLQGNLFLNLPGDPSLRSQDLSPLFAKLTSLGVKTITGNVVIVSGHAGVDSYPPGWLATDTRYSYGAPVAPVVLDENRLTVTINPGQSAGAQPLVELSVPNQGIQINNQAKTQANTKKCGLGVSLDKQNHLNLAGCIGLGQWAIQQRMPILNPLGYAEGAVRQQLLDQHINFAGQVMLGSQPANSLLLAEHQSKPIAQLMADTLKPSDNLYADSLFLLTAANLAGRNLNWAEAQGTVKNFLQQQTGINFQEAKFMDGSGLSLQDKVSPAQTIGLLRFLHRQFPLAFEYISALPIAGVDGTLQKRFKKPNERGLLRAKTGTMTGISSLSGYLYTPNGHTLAFSIFINKTKGTRQAFSGKLLIEAICDYFLQHRPTAYKFPEAATSLARVAFEQKPNQRDRERSYNSKWRKLEFAVKQALQGKPVAVIFRGNELILQDNSSDPNSIWSALEQIRKRYSFSVALQSSVSPAGNHQSPFLLWIKSNNPVSRTWTLGETG